MIGMKRFLLLFSIFLFGLLGKAQSTYSPSTTQTISLTCGVTHTFTDDKGPAANYSKNMNYTVTFVPATPGQCIKITFNVFDVDNSDFFQIFDGPNSLGTYFGGSLANANAPLPVFTSTSGAISVGFISDGSGQGAGWLTLVECTPCLGPQISMSSTSQTLTCGNVYQFFDSGGPSGNYSNSQSLTHKLFIRLHKDPA